MRRPPIALFNAPRVAFVVPRRHLRTLADAEKFHNKKSPGPRPGLLTLNICVGSEAIVKTATNDIGGEVRVGRH